MGEVLWSSTDTRDTAYREEVEQDGLSRRQAEVLETLKEYGSGSAREVFQSYTGDMLFSSFQPRLTKELPEKGVVMPVGKKTCSVTGRTVMEWVAV